MRVAVYPGSFDPPTLGHVDVIQRAARLFDTLIVAVGQNTAKSPLFPAEERADMLRELTQDMPGVVVECFDGLLVDFVTAKRAGVVVRGLRAGSDFENEFQMALANRALSPGLETVFLMTSAEHMFLSSSIVKEVARLGGDVSTMVPEEVRRRIERG